MGRAFFWTFVSLQIVACLIICARVGLPRRPYTGGDAALAVLTTVGFVAWAAYETGLLYA